MNKKVLILYAILIIVFTNAAICMENNNLSEKDLSKVRLHKRCMVCMENFDNDEKICITKCCYRGFCKSCWETINRRSKKCFCKKEILAKRVFYEFFSKLKKLCKLEKDLLDKYCDKETLELLLRYNQKTRRNIVMCAFLIFKKHCFGKAIKESLKIQKNTDQLIKKAKEESRNIMDSSFVELIEKSNTLYS
jgi:hypothetical protein